MVCARDGADKSTLSKQSPPELGLVYHAPSQYPLCVGQGMRTAPRAPLLARDRASSDDLEAGDGPDPVRPPAEPPIHPFTGKFADPDHTVAYRSQAFRRMMPLHIVAMALMIVIELLVLASDASTGNAASDVVAAEVAVTAFVVLGLRDSTKMVNVGELP